MNKMILSTLLAACIGMAARAEDGFVPLFNGKDLTGWKLHPETNKGQIKDIKPVEKDGKVVAYEGVTIERKGKDGKTPEGKPFKLWRVEDGCIVGGGPMSHLFTDRDDYADYHVRMEVKIADKSNSGFFYRAGFRGGVPKGYEAQINATQSDWRKTGTIYPNGEFGLTKYEDKICVKECPHKPDVFFVYEIISKGDTTTLKVDGKQVMEWKDPENRFTKGHFALQAHDPNSVMTFRKIEVKELK